MTQEIPPMPLLEDSFILYRLRHHFTTYFCLVSCVSTPSSDHINTDCKRAKRFTLGLELFGDVQACSQFSRYDSILWRNLVSFQAMFKIKVVKFFNRNTRKPSFYKMTFHGPKDRMVIIVSFLIQKCFFQYNSKI